MSEKEIQYCPGCPNHCPSTGPRCIIGMTHFNYQPEPYWIKKTDKKEENTDK